MTGQTTRLAWTRTVRTLMAGSYFAMALGALACTGIISTGAPGANGKGAGASGPSGAGSTASTVTGGGGRAGATTSLTLDSGRTVVRRLNRTEYNFTVRDSARHKLHPGRRPARGSD